MSCVMTWAQSFLTSEVMEAVRGQKHPWEAKKRHETVDLSKKVFLNTVKTEVS